MPATADADEGGRRPTLTTLSRGYAGPERRTPRPDWLTATLDEVDYGMILLTDTGQVVHANQVAHSDLDGEHPLQLSGREVRARHVNDSVALHTALQNAVQRGMRKLLTLGDSRLRVSVSVVPICADPAPGEASVLMILGKRQVCESLSVQGFARGHNLTPAETRVLVELCQGVPPTEVAAALGVGIATVRSQIGSIRQKTGAQSIRALVRQIAVLPPLMSVLRHGAPHDAPHDAPPERQPIAA
ncbi:MAG TPA: helix-turn-helix transcriptional regulator [Burkholderiaceae bacterium]|jgi:DNA-binding CsgD family transcriptional regulator